MQELQASREQGAEIPRCNTPSSRGEITATMSADKSSVWGRNDLGDFPLSGPSSHTKLSVAHYDTYMPTPVAVKKEPVNISHAPNDLPTSATACKSPPHDLKLGEVRHSSSRPGAHTRPVASWLSSGQILTPATQQQQTSALNTKHLHNLFLAGNNLACLNRLLTTSPTATECTKSIKRSASMQDFDLRDDDLRLGEDINFEDFSNYEDAPGMCRVDARTPRGMSQYAHN